MKVDELKGQEVVCLYSTLQHTVKLLLLQLHSLLALILHWHFGYMRHETFIRVWVYRMTIVVGRICIF